MKYIFQGLLFQHRGYYVLSHLIIHVFLLKYGSLVFDNFVCSLPPRYIFRRVTRVVRSYVCRFAIPDTLSNQEILDMTGLTARQFADFTRRIVRAGDNARGHLVNDVSALIYLYKGLSIYHLLRREMS